MQEDGVCTACKQGTLVKTTVRRMNGFVVVVGFILLVASVIGVLFGGLGAALSNYLAKESKRSPQEIESELRGLSVSEPLIQRILAGQQLTSAELSELNQQQQMVVAKETIVVMAKKAPSDVDVGASGLVLFTSLAGVSVVVGIVGWLFIRKKWVFLCTKCPAVVPAT